MPILQRDDYCHDHLFWINNSGALGGTMISMIHWQALLEYLVFSITELRNFEHSDHLSRVLIEFLTENSKCISDLPITNGRHGERGGGGKRRAERYYEKMNLNKKHTTIGW